MGVKPLAFAANCLFNFSTRPWGLEDGGLSIKGQEKKMKEEYRASVFWL
jgi:hypothetical protein